MGLVEVVFSIIDQVYVVTREVHSEGNIGMVSRIIIHQRDKQTNDINNAQERKKENIKIPG